MALDTMTAEGNSLGTKVKATISVDATMGVGMEMAVFVGDNRISLDAIGVANTGAAQARDNPRMLRITDKDAFFNDMISFAANPIQPAKKIFIQRDFHFRTDRFIHLACDTEITHQ